MIKLTEKHYAIPVPVDASNLVLHDLDDCSKLVFTSTIQDPLQCGGDMIRIPKGNWRFLFTTKEATENDARMVVEPQQDGYKDYDSYSFHKAVPFTLALDSFIGLLRSKGCSEGNWAILQKD